MILLTSDEAKKGYERIREQLPLYGKIHWAPAHVIAEGQRVKSHDGFKTVASVERRE